MSLSVGGNQPNIPVKVPNQNQEVAGLPLNSAFNEKYNQDLQKLRDRGIDMGDLQPKGIPTNLTLPPA